MNALLLLKLIHLEQVGIRFVVAVGLESIKAELFVRARVRSRGEASSQEAPSAHLTRADFRLSDCSLVDIEPLLADRLFGSISRNQSKGKSPFAGRHRTQVRNWA